MSEYHMCARYNIILNEKGHTLDEIHPECKLPDVPVVEMDIDILLRFIREYGRGQATTGSTYYLKSDANRRLGVYKKMGKLIDKIVKKLTTDLSW